MIEWREEFSFGIERIDNQHKEFLVRLNQFLLSLKKGEAKNEIYKVFGFLKEYVVYHFEDEERFIKEIGFSDFEKHKVLHNDFKKEIENLGKELDKGISLYLTIKISKKLTDWFINHIGKADKKYAFFYKKLNNV